jgi:hypothetical protein
MSLTVPSDAVLSAIFIRAANQSCVAVCNFCTLFRGNIIMVTKTRRIRWVIHVGRMKGIRNAYKILFGKPERKIPLERPRHRWGDKIKMYFKEMCVIV